MSALFWSLVWLCAACVWGYRAFKTDGDAATVRLAMSLALAAMSRIELIEYKRARGAA